MIGLLLPPSLAVIKGLEIHTARTRRDSDGGGRKHPIFRFVFRQDGGMENASALVPAMTASGGR